MVGCGRTVIRRSIAWRRRRCAALALLHVNERAMAITVPVAVFTGVAASVGGMLVVVFIVAIADAPALPLRVTSSSGGALRI